MKRPLFTAGLVFLPVMWAAFFVAWRDALMISFAFATAAVMVGLTKRKEFRVVSLCLFSAALALGVYAGHCLGSIEPLQRLGGTVAEFSGVITRIDTYSGVSYYEVKARFPDESDLPSTTIRLASIDQLGYGLGDSIRCRIPLALSENRPNFHKYKAQGITLQGFVNDDLVKAGDGSFPFTAFFYRLRARLARRLEPVMSAQGAGIVSSMVLGNQSILDSETSMAFKRSGTSHLLSISGLHLSILLTGLQRLLRKTRLSRRAVNWICSALVVLYAALVGFSTSIVRAGAMSMIMLIAPIVSKRNDGLNSLGFACILLCCIRPYWAWSMALWLSAAATLGILLVGSKWADWLYERLKGNGVLRNRFLKVMVAPVMISLAATLFTLPLQTAMSGYLSLVSPLANLLVTPFVGLSIVTGLLGALLPAPLAGVAALAADLSVTMIVSISRLCAGIPFAVWPLDETWIFIWLLGTAAVAVVVLSGKERRKMAVAGGMLCVIALCAGNLSLALSRQNTVELVTLEGTNSALLIRGDEAVVLGTPNQYDAGSLLEYLTFRGISRVEAIVAWDSGPQMTSGLTRLCAAYPVSCVIGPDNPIVLEQLSLACRADAYKSTGLTMEVLGGVILRPRASGLVITAGDTNCFQSGQEYAILEDKADWRDIGLFRDGVLAVYRDGQAILPRTRIFHGETRLILEMNP